jgi:hypothetical protein
VRTEVKRLKRVTEHESLNSKQAEILMKLAKTYQLMDTATDKEHLKYRLNERTDEDLKSMLKTGLVQVK